ncbi:MAG: translation initiation factor IF-6 [Thermoplasmata archaeon]|nr:translation initiation factor IF-6 [Thermoplasmata archaeon]
MRIFGVESMLKIGMMMGSPYVGVFCAASEKLAILPEATDPWVKDDLQEALGVDVLCTYLAGSVLIGSLASMNSNGIVVTNFADKSELKRLPKDLRVGIMEEKLNAAGNNILANDHGAYVNLNASRSSVKIIEDTLGVEVLRRTIASIYTVGSVAIVTSKGIVCHPRTSQDELKEISAFFKVPAALATLNYGTPYLGACAVANSKGAYIGGKSTPIELGKLEDGLGLY